MKRVSGDPRGIQRSHERRLLGHDLPVVGVAEASLRSALGFALFGVLAVRPALALAFAGRFELGVVRRFDGPVPPVGRGEVEQAEVVGAETHVGCVPDHVHERADPAHDAVELPCDYDVERARTVVGEHALVLGSLLLGERRPRTVDVDARDLPSAPRAQRLAVLALALDGVSRVGPRAPALLRDAQVDGRALDGGALAVVVWHLVTSPFRLSHSSLLRILTPM